MFGGKLDVGAPEDDFGGGHALPSFGPGWQMDTMWNRYFDKTNLLLSVISSYRYFLTNDYYSPISTVQDNQL